MTDLIKMALLTSLPPTLTALGSFIVSLKTNVRMTNVEKSVDGVKDELVRATQKKAFAEGVKHEKDNPSGGA